MNAVAQEQPGDNVTRIMNQEEFLAHLGVTLQSLWRYKKMGMPCMPMAGKQTFYDVAKATEWLESHGLNGKVGRPPAAAASLEEAEAKQKLLDAKVRKETVLAERHEHALARLKGEVVSFSSVQESHLRRVQVVKAGLMSLPGKVASRCANRPAHEVQAELEAEVHALLTEFSRPPEVIPCVVAVNGVNLAPPEVT